MKRLAAIIVACLIAIPSVTFGPSSRVARADAPRYTSVPLDSLPLEDSDSSGARIITGQNPDQYRDTTLNSGVQLPADCQTGTATFRLHGKYDELSGVIYDTYNDSTDAGLSFVIYDSSDPANKRVLYSTTVHGLDQTHFSVRVRGVDYLSLFSNYSGGCGSWPLDIVATLSIGTLPPTAVVSRYPAANAGVPANSKVLVGWQPFLGATNYLFHVWVVNTDASATITAKTPLAFSATAYHSTKYTWDDTGFPTGAYQYALLPLDAKGKALAGWSAPTQITIAS
jgi:hypothetical protein